MPDDDDEINFDEAGITSPKKAGEAEVPPSATLGPRKRFHRTTPFVVLARTGGLAVSGRQPPACEAPDEPRTGPEARQDGPLAVVV